MEKLANSPIAQIAMPVAAGLASAASPPLARGVHGATSMMGRLGEIQQAGEMRPLQVGLAKARLAAVPQEQALLDAQIKKAQRPQTVDLGGGRHGILQYGEGGKVTGIQEVGQPWVGSEPWKKAEIFKTDEALRQSVANAKTQLQKDIALDIHKKGDLERQAQLADVLLKNMDRELGDFARRMKDVYDPKEVDRGEQAIRSRYAGLINPLVESISRELGNTAAKPFMEVPPQGYTKLPQTWKGKPIWIDPKNPSAPPWQPSR